MNYNKFLDVNPEVAEALAAGKTNRVICQRNATLIDIDIEEGLAMKKGINEELFRILETMTNG